MYFEKRVHPKQRQTLGWNQNSYDVVVGSECVCVREKERREGGRERERATYFY